MKIKVRLVGSAWRDKKDIKEVEVVHVKFSDDESSGDFWPIDEDGFEVEFIEHVKE